MLREKSIISLCVVGLKQECLQILKCDNISFDSDILNFDDLQQPIELTATTGTENQKYICKLKDDRDLDTLLITLTKNK